MMMNDSTLELLEKWRADPGFANWAAKSNAEDVVKWDAYFAANPEHRKVAELAKVSLLIRPRPLARGNERALNAFADLQKKIAARPSGKGASVRQMRSLRSWIAIAASLLILVTAYWGYDSLLGKGDEIVLTTQNATQEVLLADGTKVTMNTHTTLKYLSKDTRNVELNGEAYFEVTKQPETGEEFMVKTKDLTVTVLGTSFNVNSQAGQTSVFLDEGLVRLGLEELDDRQIEMNPGELVSYSREKRKVLEERKAHSLEKTAWKESVILFEEAPIAEVLETVSILYGITFEAKPFPAKEARFTGGVPTDNLDITLQTLQKVYAVDIVKIEEKYMIESVE